MIAGPTEIRESLAGAGLVMLGRAEGLARFDLSVGGFWRSFSAILLILPLAALAIASERAVAARSGLAVPAFTAADFWANAAALAVDWIAFPLIFAVIAKPFGFAARYVAYIVARNWAAVVISGFVSIVHILALVVLPSEIASFLLIIALVAALRFSYVVARIALQAPVGFALPIVILDFLVSFTIWSFAGGAQAAG